MRFLQYSRRLRRRGLSIGRLAVLCAAPLAPLKLVTSSLAADLPSTYVPPIVSPHNWSGLTVGFHAGYGFGDFGPATNPLPIQGAFFPESVTGFIGGFQAGYDHRYANGLVLGVEASVSFPSQLDQRKLIATPYNTTLEYFAMARARAGYAIGDMLPYVIGGLAWGATRVDLNDADGAPFDSKFRTHPGWTVGAGLAYAVAERWTAHVEYNYVALASAVHDLNLPSRAQLAVEPNIHSVRLGLSYKLTDGLWGKAAAAPQSRAEADLDGWSIHGETTFLPQAYPSFRSPYQGPNSLPGRGQGRETWTATAFVGRRLWEGGEFYFNPELAQGSGLGGTMGLGGFANGEAQKAGAPYPRVRAQRYFLRQTIGLGGEQEAVEDGPNQIAGKRDIDRVTVTVGRFAVGDFFDDNAYAHDPRADFMNWAMWSSAAYDFPADLPGFTRGAVVELNRKDWALRAGWFQVPEAPNSDVLTFKTGGAVLEWEGRYTIANQAGTLRLGAFYNRGHMANYREAIDLAAASPGLDINAITASIRRDNPKYGFYANVEQALSKDVGLFARASWNDGKNEILSFTDVDRSASGGLSIKGASWGRPDDKIGLGGAINGLSSGHRDFLAAGGLGLLIGDGRLNYRHEKIFETFYAYSVDPRTTLTVDYQFIANPAYNADRGPVSIFAGRLHAEF